MTWSVGNACALAIRLAIYWAEHPRIRPRETDGSADLTCYNRTQHNPAVLLSSDYGSEGWGFESLRARHT